MAIRYSDQSKCIRHAAKWRLMLPVTLRCTEHTQILRTQNLTDGDQKNFIKISSQSKIQLFILNLAIINSFWSFMLQRAIGIKT